MKRRNALKASMDPSLPEILLMEPIVITESGKYKPEDSLEICEA